jgi:lia operon protein LiaG
MSNSKKVLLIFGCVALVCLIGAAIVVGVYFGKAGSGAGIADLLGGERVTLDETQTLDLDGVTSLSVECPSGAITLAPGDEVRVELSGSIWTAKTKDQYLKVTQDGGALRVKLDLDPIGVNFIDVQMKVYLPEDFGMETDISSASGGIDVQNLELGPVTVSCASGDVNISGVKGGALRIDSASGKIKVASSQFESIRATCQSGGIDVRDTNAAVTLHCTSGEVNVADVTGSIDVSSTSGGVTVSLSQPEIEEIRADVTSGSITLKLNAQAAFTLDANTTSGGIDCDFERTVSGGDSDGPVGEHITGKVNGGGASVNLSTVSGGINIIQN